MTRTILAMAAVLLASCMLHGQANAEMKPYKVSNYPSHNSSFFAKMLSGRVWVFEGTATGKLRDIPQAVVFDSNGRRIRCNAGKTSGGEAYWISTTPGKWEEDTNQEASLRYVYQDRKPGYTFFFYESKTGTLANEVWRRQEGGEVVWLRHAVGWVQDSWPRMLVNACPLLDLPAGMKVNEKQIAQSLRELRRQDPDAVIRRFPGSEMTGPGRIGIAKHGVPTTTGEDVWAFMNAQEGNVILGPKGQGRVFVRGADGADWHEVWGLKDEGDLAWTAGLVEAANAEGDWLHWVFDGKVVARYRMGDPLPYLATGHRHGAFRLTDGLIGGAEATVLPFMGDAYADRRFVFIGDGSLVVVDPDGNLAPGDGFEGTWRWTKGRLEVRVAGDSRVHGIDWQDLARELGVKPVLVTRAMLNER